MSLSILVSTDDAGTDHYRKATRQEIEQHCQAVNEQLAKRNLRVFIEWSERCCGLDLYRVGPYGWDPVVPPGDYYNGPMRFDLDMTADRILRWYFGQRA
jgi:hypothetical protein